ncbi:MAG: MerR family transcriptional regulator, partial [Lautropia sp.]|nr:MerR family transcriptional regulator [Lautropia sp.]
IDEVSRRSGLSIYTLRYYERIGLIAPVLRDSGGRRRYAESDLAWIAFLLRLKATRMPIAQMKRFAELRSAGDHTIAERRTLLEAHLKEVSAQIRSMQHAARALKDKIAHYHQQDTSQAADAHQNQSPSTDEDLQT